MARFTVFTKPWKEPLPDLARRVAGMGFWGVELPVRPGYQVEPDNIEPALGEAAKVFADHGVTIHSVAGPEDERTIAACAAAGVSILRVMAKIADDGYLACEARIRRRYDELAPVLAEHGVTLGVQNHCGAWVGSAVGIRRLIEDHDPRHVAAVYDPAHCALVGEPPALAVDILADRMCMVNLKNVFWWRTNGPEAETAAWRWHWTTGRQGLADWARVAAELNARGYDRPICLCAEYSEEGAAERLAAEDLAYARRLLEPGR